MQNKKPRDRVKFLFERFQRAAKHKRQKEAAKKRKQIDPKQTPLLIQEIKKVHHSKKKSERSEVIPNPVSNKILKRLNKQGITEIKRPELITDLIKPANIKHEKGRPGYMDDIGDF